MDIIAQYWQLIAQPGDSRSGDYGYSEDDMKRFGAQEGFRVYKDIEKAADRNVSIRYSFRFVYDRLGLSNYEFPFKL